MALQTLPVLLLAPYDGVVADRVDKRRLMIVLQIVMGFQALALGLLTVLGAVRFWQVCVLAVIPCTQSSTTDAGWNRGVVFAVLAEGGDYLLDVAGVAAALLAIRVSDPAERNDRGRSGQFTARCLRRGATRA